MMNITTGYQNPSHVLYNVKKVAYKMKKHENVFLEPLYENTLHTQHIQQILSFLSLNICQKQVLYPLHTRHVIIRKEMAVLRQSIGNRCVTYQEGYKK